MKFAYAIIPIAVIMMIVSGMTLPLIAPNPASASSSKIQHLIFIVQENHSFDNYFGTYPGANGLPMDVAIPFDPNQTNLGYVKPFHLNVSQPIMIVGDELPPGVADPDATPANPVYLTIPFRQ